MKNKFIILSILILSGCRGIKISDLPQIDLKYQELPSEIQKTYIKTFGKNVWFDYFIVNLDSSKTTIKFEDTGKAGVYPGKKKFTINDTEYILPWNANAESPPFILSKKKFYYRFTPTVKSMNPLDTIDLMNSQYRMVDLTNHLKY